MAFSGCKSEIVAVESSNIRNEVYMINSISILGAHYYNTLIRGGLINSRNLESSG